MPVHRTIPRICEQCGAPFMTENYQIRIGGGRFCSRKCANRANAKPPQPIEDRFWRFVVKTETCWLWVGARDRKGYGKITIDDRPVLAHRLSWELVHGPIPDGLNALHNCPGGDNPSCVNPAHLFLGTLQDNNADMLAKGRYARGMGLHRSDLTDDDVREIRALYAAGGIAQRQLARRYGITQVSIGEIVRREVWKHVV